MPTTGMTVGQAAAPLGVDVRTVQRWARTEQCPVIRDSRRVRIPTSWIDELIAKGWK